MPQRNTRIAKQGYCDLAAARGYEWLGPEVPNNRTKTTWRCHLLHEWQSTYSNVVSGHGCPYCAGNAPLTAGNYAELAHRRRFIWLGPFVSTARTKTRWQCTAGHVWEISYYKIQRGDGCPHCSGNARQSPSAYHQQAEQKGYQWLGPEVSNVDTITQWLCPKGHIWEASYWNFSIHNCPKCIGMVNGVITSKPQIALHAMLGGEINFPVKRYRIDIAIDINSVKVAVEYDCAFYHDTVRDTKRDAVLLSLGWRILRIKSANLLPTLEQLNTAIQRLVDGSTYEEIVLTDWRG